jgi:Na+-transporting NADH:ubiquinone oxidoreductase subunit NqrF
MTTTTTQPEVLKVNGRLIQDGTEISISGEPGRFIYRWMTGDALTVWGGRTGNEMYRSFTIDRVRRVHSKPKSRGHR